jgi:hypothetical protein
MTALTGGCLCGAIRYTATGEPAHHALCHCHDCRRSAGATFVGWALFPREQVTISGAPVDYESSPGTHRQFCGRCGTGLFFLSEAVFPGQIDIQSATLDDPDQLPPQASIQMAEAPAWIDAVASLPRFARFPG